MDRLFELTGRLHPVLVHLPIGFLLLAVLFQWLSAKEKYSNLAPAVRISYFLGMISAILSCMSGWLLSATGGYEEATLNAHKWFGIAVAALATAGYWLERKAGRMLRRMVSLVLLLLIIITGHLGGTLTHGEGFLTGSTSHGDSTMAAKKKLTDVQGAVVFADIIQPIFNNKCTGCHGATKQKGGLRLDGREGIEKGGKNGKVYVAGNAGGSELFRRITLDPLDEKHMAPKGKPQLTEQEITLLRWWIDSNAGFDKKVKEVPQPTQVALALKALQNTPVTATVEVPDEPVEKVDDAVLDTLRKAGIVVLPVSSSSHYLLANFVSIPKLDERTVALLQLVKKQLVWLKLNYAAISDASWAIIGNCTRLTRLSIEHTNLTDRQLTHLVNLKELVYLNLVGTKVSLQGLQQLNTLKHLSHLYLGNTLVKGDDFNKLKTLFPTTQIDSGNYRLERMASDTEEVRKVRSQK